MTVSDVYDGSNDPFEGERTVVWRSLPANAKVTKATVTVAPTAAPDFEEVINFTNGQGDWGATTVSVPGSNSNLGSVEVDFHKRRTLVTVEGTSTSGTTGIQGTNLQVDLGGLYVEINNKGAVKSPNDPLFSVPSDGKLPGLTVNKFKLTESTQTTITLEVTRLTVRSAPTNVSVRLGKMAPFWTHLGELVSADTSPDFAALLQTFLSTATVENGFYLVPLVIHSDTIARLKVDLEVEVLSQANVLPQGLREVVIPYDFSTVPKTASGVLSVALPADAQVVPGLTTAKVIGAFESTHIVHGPTGADLPVATARVSANDFQAQPVSFDSNYAATAVNLLVAAVATAARLRLDLRADLDGKPDAASLLSGPVDFSVDPAAGKDPTWLSVPLPATFSFQDRTKRRYWIVLQGIEGEADWGVQPAPTGAAGMQHTQDGGLSWRRTIASGIPGPLVAFMRLEPTGAAVSPNDAQAQIISLDTPVSATAMDLLIAAVSTSAQLTLDLRGDLDGKPDSVSLLPRPVQFNADATVTRQANWISVPLPGKFSFQEKTKRRYWIVLQSLGGEATWIVQPAPAGALGTQHTQDGGLSWRNTSTFGFTGPLSASFRLRDAPASFQVPIELQVGTGEQANRVKLDRFQPLGRVDFALDKELAHGVNQYLAKATPGACPEVDHLANGDFEQWLQSGKDPRAPKDVPLGSAASPTTVAFSPDGTLAYVVADSSLVVVDAVCDKPLGPPPTLALSGSPVSNTLVITPNGHGAYLVINDTNQTNQRRLLQAVDTGSLLDRGSVGFDIAAGFQVTALALTPDGKQLYWSVYDSTTPSGQIQVADTAAVEQAIGNLQPVAPLPKPISLQSNQPIALAVSPDGSLLYVAISASGQTSSQTPAESTPSAAAGPQAAASAGQAAAASANGSGISVFDIASQRLLRTIPLRQLPLGMALTPDGSQLLMALSGVRTLNVIDLAQGNSNPLRPEQLNPQQVAVTPQNTKIYVVADGGLKSIQLGDRLPAEWTLTSGAVEMACFPQPAFHLVAILGNETSGQTPMPSALSQVVPVSAQCPYEFNFWAVSTDVGAAAEVFWLSDEGGPLRTDQVPIKVADQAQVNRAQTVGTLTHVVAVITPRPIPLQLHRTRLAAPAGANQAEVRFSVPVGVVAAVAEVSLKPTADRLANGDFRILVNGRPDNWTLSPPAAPGVLLSTVDEKLQLQNVGANSADLHQTVPITAGKPFSLEFQGRNVTSPQTQAVPRLELRWVKVDGSPAGPLISFELSPRSFQEYPASGVTPAGTTQAEVHLIAPPGTTVRVDCLSLRSTEPTSVPLTFVSHAPGELRVSGAQVVYDRAKPVPPPVPAKGLRPPTPPDKKPGDPLGDTCFCSCCGKQSSMTKPAPAKTPAGRPAVVGSCTTCGAQLVRLGGPQIPGAPVLPFTRVPAHPNIPSFMTAQMNPIQTLIPPLTALVGINGGRARQLAAVGITSMDALAAADPKDVAQALKGVSAESAAVFVKRAQEVLASVKRPRSGLPNSYLKPAVPVSTVTAVGESRLTVILGLGKARAQRLASVGIDSVQTLAASTPADVAEALKGTGVSAGKAALFIEKAKLLLVRGKAP